MQGKRSVLMWKNLQKFCAGLVCAMLLIMAGSATAIGQTSPNLENGFKAYGSYDGSGLDSVNLLNGNLMLHIPMPWSYPQRGDRINPRNLLTVTSKGWSVQCVPNGTGQTCFWTNAHGLSSAVAARGNGVGLDFDVDLALHRTMQTESDNGSVSYGGFGYYLDTADGAIHWLAASPNAALDGNGDPMSLDSVDITGFHIDLSNPDSVTGVPATAVATNRHGNRYLLSSFTGPCTRTTNNNLNGNTITTTCTQAAGIASITDGNGNVYGVGPSAAGPDTMGRGFVAFNSSAPASSSAAGQCVTGGRALSSATTYTYPGPGGASNQVTVCGATLNLATQFGEPGVIEAQNAPGAPQPITAIVLVTVVLSDGSKWTFNYDSYGEVTQIGLPLGGTITYTWTTLGVNPGCSSHMSRAVASRTLNDNTGHSFTWNYTWGTPGIASVTNTVSDPQGNDTAHVFSALHTNAQGQGCPGYETRTQYYQGTGNSRQLLQQVDTTYSSAFLSLENGGGTALGNVVPTSIQTTAYPSGKVKLVTKSYDPGLGAGFPIFGNVTVEKEYDWGQGSPGALLRETDTTYQWQNDGRYLTAHMLDLPASVITKDGNGNRVAETDYTYDESQYLTASNITTQHGAAPNAVRGNLTTVSKWLNTSTSPVVDHTNWYDTGEVYQTVDPLGNKTTHSYDPAYAGAYSTGTCNALSQCVSGAYDFHTGLLTSFTDANGNTSNYSYDSLGRMTQAQLPPDPAGNRPQTSFTYSAASTVPFNVQRQKSITPSLTDVSTTYFDGLGRAYQTQHATPNGTATVQTTYDGLDHVVSVTNPYFSTSDATYGVTQTQYDALGRVTQTTKQDGSFVITQYDQPGILPNGNCTFATDETGKPRKACSDALGRLIEVEEPNPASTFKPGWDRSLQQFGSPGDIPVPGDYDGDGITDFAVWRPDPSTGQAYFLVLRSSDGGETVQRWGGPGDTPVPGDYDGDGKTDFAVWRPDPSTGESLLFVLRSSDGVETIQQWGSPGDTPVPGDYDGDGKTDIAVWRPDPSTGQAYFLVLRSSDGGETVQRWGGPGDIPVPKDYDGDHKTDFAVWRPSNGYWFVLRSSDGQEQLQQWGTQGDSPVPGDYDGDGKADYAVWRPSNATWYVVRSRDGQAVVQTWGSSSDVAVAGNYQVGGQTDFAVWDPNTGTWSVSLSQVTLYSYDALGNLLQVVQKGDPRVSSGSQWRVRSFTYDSLLRLLTATNPESGQISYSYDANGNVLQKTSPAPNQTGTATQTVSYCYDKLNRVTGKAYSAQTCTNGQLPSGTAVVSYGYDAGANGIGHLTSLTDQAGLGSYSYDALGRLSSEQRTIAGVSKSLGYSYNLDSSIATLIYPSGAVITYTPDAAGRMLSAVDAGNNINYVTNASYGPDNSLTGYINGKSSSFSGISNVFSYNQRLQPCRMTATTGTAPANCTDGLNIGTVLDLSYDFHLYAGDNGNVYRLVNNKDLSRIQTFTYDALNRLTSAQNAGADCSKTTANGKTEYWGNSYGYDAWGNLINKTPTKCGAENLSVTALANNQLSGYGYDAAGNMTYDASTGNRYSFDQENRITGAAGYTYTYDADGNRVEKSNDTTGTIYWSMSPGIVAESDLSGNLTAEYVFFGGKRVARKDLPSKAVSYYFADSLQTAAVITDSAGNIKEDEDFYPWGLDLPLVNGDPNHYKFTGKEQDSETGLYYYGARYYEDGLGRFMSPDPKQLSLKHLLFPQRWNKYAYVQNNPIGSIDPDGYEDYKVFLAAPEAGGNWNKAAAVAKANGHTLTVYKGKDASIGNFNAALTDHNNRVIFVGHTSHEPGANGGAGPANAAVLGDGRSAGMVSTHQELGPTDANGVANATEVPNTLGTIVNADTVALFGCDSINLAPNFSGAGNFVGVDSGADNVSTFGAMSAGAEAFVEADAAARPAGAGGTVSDATVNSSNQAFQKNRGTDPGVGTDLDGDKVRKAKPD